MQLGELFMYRGSAGVHRLPNTVLGMFHNRYLKIKTYFSTSFIIIRIRSNRETSSIIVTLN